MLLQKAASDRGLESGGRDHITNTLIHIFMLLLSGTRINWISVDKGTLTVIWVSTYPK